MPLKWNRRNRVNITTANTDQPMTLMALTGDDDTQLAEARAILDRHVKQYNSSLKRFFSRTAKPAYFDILQHILADLSINHVATLIQRLQAIKPFAKPTAAKDVPTDPLFTMIESIKNTLTGETLLLCTPVPALQAIAAFINQFNYHPAEEHQRGTMMDSHSSNQHNLSQQLSAIAQKLTKNLQQLLTPECLAEAITSTTTPVFTRFLLELNIQLASIRAKGLDCAEIHYNQPSSPTMHLLSALSEAPTNTAEPGYFYRIPIKDTSFERNFVQALSATKEFLDGEQKLTVENLINEVERYSPTPVLVQRR